MTFVERTFAEINPATAYIPGAYANLVAAKLDDCRTGKIKRLMILAPPRGMKSISASIALPAFILGHNPSAQIISVCYGQDLATTFARDCRQVMESSWYRDNFDTRLDTRAVGDLKTTKGGLRYATSVGGVLTGRGADFLILDDLIKPEDALSEVQRTKVNDWIRSTLLSRLNSKTDGCIILVMQRLHMDDPAGRLMESGEWEVVTLPAIAEEDEEIFYRTPFGKYAFRRKAGEPLHPERDSLEALRKIEREIGRDLFSAQYQQRPVPIGGNMVKEDWLLRHDFYPTQPGFIWVVQSWDTANKAGELNDYSVCTTWGVKLDGYYLLDVYRKRVEFPELRKAVREQAVRFKANKILIEDKASGTQLIQDLEREGLMGITPHTSLPGIDKIMRFGAVTPLFEVGKIFLPRQATWLREYEKELLGFPAMKHDDQVDSTSQALEYFKTNDKFWVWAKLAE